MPTNDERRKVAEEIRIRIDDGYDFNYRNVSNAIGVDFNDYDDPYMFDEDAWTRLAELIEPEPELTCHITRKPPAVKGNWGYGFCSFCGTGIEYAEAPFYCTNCGARNVDDQKVSNGAMRIYRKLLKGLNDAD